MDINEKINNKIIENVEDSLKTVAHKLGVNTDFWCQFNATSNKQNITGVSDNISMTPTVFNKLQLSFKSSPIITKQKENGFSNVEIRGKLNWLYEAFEGGSNAVIASNVKIHITIHTYDNDKFCIGIKTETTNKFIDNVDLTNI